MDLRGRDPDLECDIRMVNSSIRERMSDHAAIIRLRDLVENATRNTMVAGFTPGPMRPPLTNVCLEAAPVAGSSSTFDTTDH